LGEDERIVGLSDVEFEMIAGVGVGSVLAAVVGGECRLGVAGEGREGADGVNDGDTAGGVTVNGIEAVTSFKTLDV